MDAKKIDEEVRQDPHLSKVISDLELDANSHQHYALKQGRLFYKKRLVLASNSQWIPKLLQEFHSTPMGGHSGVYRTYRRVAASLYWRGMMAQITKFVAECEVCQRCKYQATSPAGLLQPLPIPKAVWEDISLDFISGLPKVGGVDTILVVVDRLTKYAHFLLIKHPYTAKTVADLFVKEVVRLHGVPTSIVSDRDPTFMSHFWKELFRLQGTQLKMSSSYHPETDGQTEVLNRGLETYLRCFAIEQPKSWMNWLHWAEYWYNTTFHNSTKITPFEAVYGRPPPTLVHYLHGETIVEAVAADLRARDEALKQLQYNLQKAQNSMSKNANQNRRDVHYQPGEWVYLKLRPHAQQTVAKRINAKLSARFYGPFLVISKIGPVAYKLQLPENSKVHPVFHVSQLKRVIGTVQIQSTLPVELEGANSNWFPEEVLAQ